MAITEARPVAGRLILLLLGAAVLVGCEDTFDPFEESDLTFSVFGYVDVTADTQYVRVAALRQSAYEDAPVEAVVTLEDLERGTAVALRDSVVGFRNGAFAHNFWTAAPVAPATTYRLTATGPTGEAATATFETPAPFPDPEFESGISQYSSPAFPPTAQSMRFTGIEQLAELRITYVLAEPATTVTVSYLDRISVTPDSALVVGFNAYADVQRALSGTAGEACPSLIAAHVLIAAATAEWPDLVNLDPETLALPSTASNVEGGLGYVGGVITRRGTWGSMQGVFSLHHQGCSE
ncbi:MAG: hypothetical protein R3362_02535 [Rhodothermales bacterium]|nr:hypothetical protein [Rhodothermales bacterium]